MNQNELDPSQGWRLYLFVGLVLLAAWISTHPYAGVWHDGVLYLAQALSQAESSPLQRDVFFKHGSQDAFTVVSYLYALVIGKMGISLSALILVLLNQCLFLAGLWLCVRGLYGASLAPWAMVAAADLSNYYGGFSIISYSETFFTARNCAEPFCLMAFWLLLRGSHWGAFTTLMLAAALHPLTALPCLMVWWFFQCLKDKRYAWFLVFVPLAIVLALAHVPPFDGLLKTYDPQWWALTRARNRFVVPLQWEWIDWGILGLDAAVLMTVAYHRHTTERSRRLFQSLVLATVTCMTLAIVSTSVLRNVLLTSLQFWRAHWILHLLAMTAVPVMIHSMWKVRGYTRFAAVYLLASCLWYPRADALWLILFAACLYTLGIAKLECTGSTEKLLWFGLLLLVLAAVGDFVMYADSTWRLHKLVVYTTREKLAAICYYPMALKLALLLACALYFLWQMRALGFCVLSVVLVALSIFWDQRTPWQSYMFEKHAHIRQIQEYVTPDGETYWQGDVMAPWILLGTPSYYSHIQGAGLLFNRDTAMDFSRREKNIGIEKDECARGGSFPLSTECVPTPSTIKRACESDPHLDLLVYPFEIIGLHAKVWSPSLPNGAEPTAYFVYPCRELRSAH
jgi:hypothetical protein